MNMRWSPETHSGRPQPRINPTFWLTLFVLAACFLLGGASRKNVWQASTLVILALPLLAWSLWRLLERGTWRQVKLPLAILAFAGLVPLVQLLPLPFDLWATLPGRAGPAEALRLAGPPNWIAFSLTPDGTIRGLLYLIPPIALFLGVVDLNIRERRFLLLAVPLAATFSLGLGALQVFAGEGSIFYLYGSLNSDSAPGLFANRNHQATLFVCSITLIGAWIATRSGPARSRMLSNVLAIAILMLMILGLTVVKSRAGILLLGPAVLACLLLLWAGERAERRTRVLAIALLGLGAGMFLSLFALHPLLERFISEPGEGQRAAVIISTFRTGLDYLPFGSGLGGFVPIYAGIEPIGQIGPAFWNHAHNDYAELWLETGLFGLAGLGLFVVWWISSVRHALRTRPEGELEIWAGAIVTLLILTHSAVDYPLRALALAAVFALACGLMTPSLDVRPSDPSRVRVKVRKGLPASSDLPQAIADSV